MNEFRLQQKKISMKKGLLSTGLILLALISSCDAIPTLPPPESTIGLGLADPATAEPEILQVEENLPSPTFTLEPTLATTAGYTPTHTPVPSATPTNSPTQTPLPSPDQPLSEYNAYLQNVTQDSITIMWQTPDRYSWSKLRYRLVGGLAWTEKSFLERTKFHEISLQGLIPDTAYEYQVSMDGYNQWSPSWPAVFTTAPDASQAFRAAIYGDSRTQDKVHREVIESIAKNEPDILFHTGDFVEFGKNYKGWDNEFFHPAADLLAYVPLYPVIGNHEYNGEERMWYYDFFSPPGNEQWYAFTYGCARFVILDSNFNFKPKGEQYTWLVEELQSSDYINSKWQIVVFHHPPYTGGSHPGDEVPITDYLVPLFEANGVDMIFSGHNHQYERSIKDGIYYIVTAGGGAYLYGFPNQSLNPYSQVRNSIYHHVTLDFHCSGDTLELNAWDLSLNLIDGPVILESQIGE
jgi:hypothetical protein